MADLAKASMSDLGESYPEMSCGCDDCREKNEDKKEKKHYPRESFTTEQMPSLKGANVGDKVKLVIEAEVVTVSKGEDWIDRDEDEDKVKTRVTLKLREGVAKMLEKDEDVEKMKSLKKKSDFMDEIMEDDE